MIIYSNYDLERVLCLYRVIKNTDISVMTDIVYIPQSTRWHLIFFSLFYALKENSNYKIKSKVHKITFEPSVHLVQYKMFYWFLKSVIKFPHN